MNPDLHSLYQYLEEVKRQPFEWGKHDCLTFATEILYRTWKLDYREFRGDYRDGQGALLHYARLRRKWSADFIGMADRVLMRDDHNIETGMLVGKQNAWMQVRLGVFAYDSFVGPGIKGLMVEPVCTGDWSWRPRYGSRSR